MFQECLIAILIKMNKVYLKKNTWQPFQVPRIPANKRKHNIIPRTLLFQPSNLSHRQRSHFSALMTKVLMDPYSAFHIKANVLLKN